MSPMPGSGRLEQFAQAVAERAVSLVMESIDMDGLLDRIDVDALVGRVDVNKLLDRVDVDALVGRVDVDKLLERVDVDALVGRVDVDMLLEHVDVGRIVDRVDIEALVAQTELGTIIAKSTSGVASEVLDVVRAQGVGLDDFVARWVDRVLRRHGEEWSEGPSTLVGPASAASGSPGTSQGTP